jgi:hypothetical protein
VALLDDFVVRWVELGDGFAAFIDGDFNPLVERVDLRSFFGEFLPLKKGSSLRFRVRPLCLC